MRPGRVLATLNRDDFSDVEQDNKGAIYSMPKPRYDDEQDETRHAAADEECCEDMADEYGWSLKRADPVEADILSVDCVFDGYCEFPPSRMDLTQGDYSQEEKEDA